jgi:hypothetical protein
MGIKKSQEDKSQKTRQIIAPAGRTLVMAARRSPNKNPGMRQKAGLL